MHTITGSESSSASRNAWTCKSTASLVRLGVELDPAESRCDIESLWSFQMLIGDPIARLATVITIGSPSPDALYSASTM